MPAWTEEGEKSGSLKKRAAKASRDKAVEAQRKNKLEIATLRLYNAMIDRKKVHATVLLNREKEELRTNMKRMRKTTGYCKEGLPPEGPHDNKHEKSPYFQTRGHVSEKRLQKWKNEEKGLQRMLLSEEELRPPWEKGSLEVAEETLGHLLNLLGYDADETKDMMEKLRKKASTELEGQEGEEEGEHDEETEERKVEIEQDQKQPNIRRRSNLRSASASSFGGNSVMSEPVMGRIDVFECLKYGTDSVKDMESKPVQNGFLNRSGLKSNRLLASASADNIFQSFTAAKFSVKDWEKEMTERYKNSLINLAKYTETVDENGGGGVGEYKRKSRPKSAPAHALRPQKQLARRRHKRTDADSGALSAGRSINDLSQGQSAHTDTGAPSSGVHLRPPACPRRRPRPVTANLPTTRAVEASVDNVRPKTAFKKPPLAPAPNQLQQQTTSRPSSASSSSRASSIPNISVDEPEGKTPPSKLTPPNTKTSTKPPSPTPTKPPVSPGLRRPKSASLQLKTTTPSSVLKTLKDGENKKSPRVSDDKSPEGAETQRPTSSAPKKRAQFAPEVESLSRSPSTGDLHSIKEEQYDHTDKGTLVSPANTAALHRRRLSSVPDIPLTGNRNLFKRSFSLPTSGSIPLGNAAANNQQTSSGDINYAKSRLPNQGRRMTMAVLPDLDSDEEEDDEPSQAGEHDLRSKWRRNLLRDAPPGFSGGNEKIQLAVSKNQRRRDMEAMIVNHESNVKDTIRKEHVRRMRKRRDIIMTLQKFAKEPEDDQAKFGNGAVQQPKKEATNVPKLAMSVGTIMQMMRLKKKAMEAKATVSRKSVVETTSPKREDAVDA